MTEVEARAIRFTIDHYEPRSARPDLETAYSNLMYACDECNMRKGNRHPPPEARTAGYRFFRPDQDIHQDHFDQDGLLLKGKTPVGEFTIDAIDLNRKFMRRIRELRQRLFDCHRYVLEGVRALKGFPIDRLPQEMKGGVSTAIKQADRMTKSIGDSIDDILKQYAHSELIDPDPEARARGKKRSERLRHIQSLYPGEWRTNRK